MNIKELAAAHPKSLVVIEAKLIHEFGHGIPLARIITDAWQAGYEAKEHDITDLRRREDPERWVQHVTQVKVSETLARRLLRKSGTEGCLIRTEINRKWTWGPDTASWGIEGDDCSVIPGAGGIVLMEAGGEWSGLVITEHDIAEFPEGTFGG